jgi:CRISPR system Cascade subunit CasA
MNLLTTPWMPAVRRSGVREKIRPCDVTSQIATDPVVDIEWPRADLRAATHEFLIGLLSTACPPAGDSAWSLWHKIPPSPTELQAHFAPYEAAFKLSGFMQEHGGLPDGSIVGVSDLLAGYPGENTVKLDSDLFIKRDEITAMGQSAAAISLFCAQAWSSGVGAGYRTGVRGGGPLTTLAFSHASDSLWSFLWLNTVAVFDPVEHGTPEQQMADVFPWLAPTRISADGLATTLIDVHPAQAYWGMPRRYSLVFEPNADRLPCSITGEIEDVIVREVIKQSYGINYSDLPHPLSPYYAKKAASEWIPVKNNPGMVAYGNWPGFVAGGKLRRPAACVATAINRLRALGGEAHLRLHGYDMDKAKAREFAEAERPLLIAAPEHEAAFNMLVEALADSATLVANEAVYAIRSARKAGGGAIKAEFFTTTEADFFATLRAGIAGSDVDFRRRWLDDVLAPTARALFDRDVAVDALAATGNVQLLQQAAKARKNLNWALRGYGSNGKKLFAALGIPAPETKSTKGKSK